MTWTLFAAAALVAVAVLVLPGLALALAAGVRGLAAVVAAPVLSAGVLVLASLVLGAAGVRWTVGSFVAVALLCAAAAVPVGLLLRRAERRRARGALPERAPRRRLGVLAVVVGAVVGGALIVVQLLSAFGAPDAISQAFDVVFHLNAVRFVLDSGDASPLVLGTLNGGSGLNAFYPSAWHALGALAVQATGGTIPLAADAISVAIAAVAWPLGCILLVRVVTGPRPVALALAGVLSAAFGQFPMLLLDWGVLYANFFGEALVPGVVALALVALGVGDRTLLDRPRAVVLLLPALLGMAGAHPSGLATAAVVLLPAVVLVQWRWFRARRAAGRRGVAAWLPEAGVLLATAVVVVLLWRLLQPPNGFAGWNPTQSPLRALFGVAAGSLTSGTPSPAIALCLLVGVVIAVLSRRLWLAAAWVLAMLLFLVGAVVPLGTLRTLLINPWYQDVYRVAAAAVVVQLPIAVLGAEWLLERLRRLLGRIPALARRAGRPALAVVGVLLVIVVAAGAVQGPHLARQVAKTHRNYALTASSPLLTTDELALLRRLPREVPASSGIADNPWDGSAFAFAISDRRVLAPHLLVRLTPEQQLVADHLRDAQHEPDVCAALRRLRIGYVLDFGWYVDANPAASAYPGLDGLDTSDAVELVDHVGDARLYRIRDCTA